MCDARSEDHYDIILQCDDVMLSYSMFCFLVGVVCCVLCVVLLFNEKR